MSISIPEPRCRGDVERWFGVMSCSPRLGRSLSGSGWNPEAAFGLWLTWGVSLSGDPSAGGTGPCCRARAQAGSGVAPDVLWNVQRFPASACGLLLACRCRELAWCRSTALACAQEGLGSSPCRDPSGAGGWCSLMKSSGQLARRVPTSLLFLQVGVVRAVLVTAFSLLFLPSQEEKMNFGPPGLSLQPIPGGSVSDGAY